MTFLSITIGSFLGTLFANAGLLWFIGNKADKVEKQRVEEFHKIQKEMMEAVRQEQERMQRYAKMEG
jgi:hypothetical protein